MDSNILAVREFARDYVNGGAGQRTAERRRTIQNAYFALTGTQLRKTCSTCYIEAIFKIINAMEKQPSRYQLKRGAVLFAFGDASKTMTNANITDELAEWHLKNTRGAASLFAVIPTDSKTAETVEMLKPNEPAEKTPAAMVETVNKDVVNKPTNKPKPATVKKSTAASKRRPPQHKTKK